VCIQHVAQHTNAVLLHIKLLGVHSAAVLHSTERIYGEENRRVYCIVQLAIVN
jgi:hypothetical protein